MHELGNVQRAVNPWAVFNPWDTQKTQSTSESSRFHIDDAAAAAVNPWAVFNPWDTEGIQPTSGNSNEGSRFHIYDDAGAATVNPWAVFNPWDTEGTQSTMEIYAFTVEQIKAEADKALRCQGNLGPERVLRLL